jgi:hypothetical protein
MDLLKLARGHWDRLLACGAVALGALLLLLGWLGVSRSSLPAEQLPYLISAGLGGLLCVAVGATLWLSADLSDEWRKLDDIHAELKAMNASTQPAPDGVGQTVPGPVELNGTSADLDERPAKTRASRSS